MNLSPQLAVWANYATGFRAPNAGQLNAFFENLLSFYKTVPNPGLKPEKSRNFEVGLRGRSPGLAWDAAIFSSRFNDLIEDSSQVGGAGVAGNPTIFQSINVSRAKINGFEFKAQAPVGRLSGGEFSASLVYGRSVGTDSNTNKPLNSTDPSKLVVGLSYKHALADIRLSATHHGQKAESGVNGALLVSAPSTQFLTPATTTWDLTSQWHVAKGVRVNAAVVNLTNQKYWAWNTVRGLSSVSVGLDAYTQPGRSANVGLTVDF